MFLSNVSDLDCETTKTILCSRKSTTAFEECSRDIHAREDDLEVSLIESTSLRKSENYLK